MNYLWLRRRITTGCTSIVSSLNNVMDKAGDNHGSAFIRAGENARDGR